MKNNNYMSATTKHLSMKVVFAALLMTFIGVQTFAQSPSQTVRGVVKSGDDNQPVPGTNIYLKNLSSVGTFSNAQGEFEFPRQLKSGDVLVFSFLGLKTTEYVVSDQSIGSITITMPADPIQMVDEVLVEGNEPTPGSASTKRLRKAKGHR